MRLRWFEDMDEDENRPYDMEEPNFFGLSIAYDPYMREVVPDVYKRQGKCPARERFGSDNQNKRFETISISAVKVIT